MTAFAQLLLEAYGGGSKERSEEKKGCGVATLRSRRLGEVRAFHRLLQCPNLFENPVESTASVSLPPAGNSGCKQLRFLNCLRKEHGHFQEKNQCESASDLDSAGHSSDFSSGYKLLKGAMLGLWERLPLLVLYIFTRLDPPRSALDALRTSKREMAVATRGIEREIGTLQIEEKKLVAEIKKTAKTGNEAATKILARQLIRLRQQIAKLQGSRAQMRGVATHTQAMYANTAVAGAMKGANKAMAAMNKQMEPAKQAKVMREFEKQSAQMDMTTEMISDSIDDALDNDEAEEETEELTQQVLDEIGIDIAAQLSSAPKGKVKSRGQDVGSSGVDDLEKRLAALRNV
ncbi:hypothetical protein R1flu_008144 [Riccia fluitans]|uniref:Uncharacterized protein n=1 Tax=Riccia fluitans TaxID=41844 RepID=A0ABD1YEH2_9MARC